MSVHIQLAVPMYWLWSIESKQENYLHVCVLLWFDTHQILTHWPLGNLNEILEVIFNQILVIDGWGISCEIPLIWMTLDFTDDKSTLVQVMAWCRQATSHYLSQCWPRSLSPYGVTTQWVNHICQVISMALVELCQCTYNTGKRYTRWFAFCNGLFGTGWFDPYPSGLLHWHWGNHMIAPVSVMQPWMIWVNHSHKAVKNRW